MRNDEAKAVRLLLWLGVPILAILALVAVFFAANRPPVVNVPSQKLPNPNGWDDFVRAGQLVQTVPLGPYSDIRKPQDWTVGELKTWAQAAAPAIAMLRQGLTKQCVHPPVRTASYMFRAETDIRELARAEEGMALYYESIGKPALAAESILDAVEMGVVIQHGGTIITAFTGNSIERVTLRHLEPLLGKLSADDLAHVAEHMQKISAERVPYSDIILEESRAIAAMDAELFARKERRLTYAVDWEAWYVDRSKQPSTLDRVKHSASFAFINKSRMIAENRAYLEALAKEQRGLYTGKSKVPLPDNPVVKLYANSFIKERGSFVRNETAFVILQTKVALMRYRTKHGRYPSNLKQLTPTYLKSVPIDPSTGKPLSYSLIDGGKDYVLL